jgi:cyclase
MLRTRRIPVILVNDKLHMVKTTAFGDRHDLGDPLNAAYVFSGFEVDELIVLDIDATRQGRGIPLSFVQALARFTTVPLTVGGGIRTLKQIEEIVALGVEKVVLCSVLGQGVAFLREAADTFGSSTIVACLNSAAAPDGSGEYQVFDSDGTLIAPSALAFAKSCEDAGAGEILVNAMDRDGRRNGYAVALMRSLNERLAVPLVALGGAGGEADVQELLSATPVAGVAAGRLHVYAPGSREVLLNYPQGQ